MKQIFSFGLTAALLLACLTGCGGQAGGAAPGGTAPSGGQTPPASSVPETPAGQGQTPPVSPDPERGVAAGEISREEALAIALDNADVPEGDAYNIKNETDSDNGIPLYDIEFETNYGDYTRWTRSGWTLWTAALSQRRRPLPSWPARFPAPVRRTYLSGKSPATAGGVTKGSCSWTA